MRRWSLLEGYALLVCFGSLIWFMIAVYLLGYGVVACQAPEFAVDDWTYGTHQTNDRYWHNRGWPYGSHTGREIRPPEDSLTAERERSWQVVLDRERRFGRRSIAGSCFGLSASAILFWVHWRIARRARREDREWVPPTPSNT